MNLASVRASRYRRKIEAKCGALAAVSAEDARGFFVHHNNRAPVTATIKDALRRYLTMDSF
jgi:hypothetical protein